MRNVSAYETMQIALDRSNGILYRTMYEVHPDR